MKPHELLEYAAKDPATWSKDEVRRLLREAATAITKQQQDAERYRWLRKQGNREKAADMTLHRMNLDAAIDAEMAGANGRANPSRRLGASHSELPRSGVGLSELLCRITGE